MVIGTITATLSILLFLATASCDAQIGGHEIVITPNANDVTLFKGNEFRKVCGILGFDNARVMFLWEKNGIYVNNITTTTDQNSLLLLSPVDLNDAGNYTCTVTVIGVMSYTASAGRLTVIDTDPIAPRSQIITEGSFASLSCSLVPEAIITWYNGTMIFSGSFSPASFSDEGNYTCDVFLNSFSVQISVRLFVVVPVEIVNTTTPVHQNLTKNQPVTLYVEFRGRQAHNLTITWFFGDTALSSTDGRIHNTFNNISGRGTTELRIPLVVRSNAGLYRVVIASSIVINEHQVLFSSQDEVIFQTAVVVPPIPPVNLTVEQISSRTARVSWSFPHRTPDQTANLVLRVTFLNGTLARRISVSGERTEMLVDGLVPANQYIVIIEARNNDGEAASNPKKFQTLLGSPLITSLQIERINITSFVILVDVAYTGGGNISSFSVSYRPTAVNIGTLPSITINSSMIEGMQWKGVAVFPGMERMTAMELNFSVSAINTFSFYSEMWSVVVPEFIAATTDTVTTLKFLTTTVDTLSFSDPPQDMVTELLPIWLIAVIASIVTVIVMLLVVAFCSTIYFRCHKTSQSKKFTVTDPSMPTAAAGENNMLPIDKAQPLDYRAQSQSSSVPSGTFTPSIDDNLHQHKREPSECSSLGMIKANITPSTTTSNSPSNLIKAPFVSQDLGLGSITEVEGSHHSDDSATESELDRTRRKLNQKEQRSTSMNYCFHNNMINSRLHRPPADGSACASNRSSHLSLTSSLPNSHPSTRHMYNSDPKLLQAPSMQRGETEYVYRDCDSVASTNPSCSNISLPILTHQYHHHYQPLRSVQYRSPTPYHYDTPEESTV